MGKHKKSREYSSSSSDSDSEEIERSKKSRKRSKKSKKHKSKKQRKKSSSESDSWVERNVDGKSPTPPAKAVPTPSAEAVQRDDWMSAANFSIPTFTKEKPKPKNEKATHTAYDPATSSRELNPYYKTGEGGMPTFKKPNDDDGYDDRRRSTSQALSTGNWRKSRPQEQDRCRENSHRPQKSTSPEENPRNLFPEKPPDDKLGITASHSDFLTDEQMNTIGAKMIKAELMGNNELANKLKDKLEKAKAFAKSLGGAAGQSNRESVVLSIRNAAGTSRPVTQDSEPKQRPQDRKKNKRVETHQDGERTKYYADDGDYDIKQMFEQERNTDGRDQDIEFAKLISKVKSNDKMDMADIFSDNIRKEKQKKTDDRDEAIREHQRMEKVLDSCNKCFDSRKMDKDLVIHVGKKIYLSIPYYEGLCDHHLTISPIQHIECSTNVDEDVWEEFLDLKKALTQLFQSKNEDVVFFETVRYLNRRPHMEIHCVASSKFEMIQFYFKKAIQEVERSTLNKKLIELKEDRNVRRSVPKRLPYFWVDFGFTGFAHIIENQETFPFNFAQEVIGGMMNLDVNKWRKPRKEQEPKRRISYFSNLLKTVLSNL